MQPVVLETLTDLEEVMDEISSLMDIDPCPDSCDGKRMLALVAAVQAYERRKFMIPFSEAQRRGELAGCR